MIPTAYLLVGWIPKIWELFEIGGGFVDVFEVKLDKMTLVADVKESYFIQRFIDTGMLEVYDYGVDIVQGTLFPKMLYKESAYFTYDQRNADTMRKRNFRLEFNPAKITDQQKDFIRKEILVHCVKDSIAFSRLDIALDCNEDISGYALETLRSKSAAVFYGINGGITGKYLGQRESHVFTRLYDKKLKELKDKKRELRSLEISGESSSMYSEEQKSKLIDEISLIENMDSWWRLEFELKGSKKIEEMLINGFSVLLDSIRIIDYDFSKIKGLEKATMVGLLERPEIFNELSKNTKSKYKKMFRELEGKDLSVDFKQALQKKEPLILAELKGWMVI